MFTFSKWRYQKNNWNKNILKFFLIQEKVYFCRRNNLEYVKFLANDKCEYVNYEKENIR